MNKDGILVKIGGIDGCGKSTQISMLSDNLLTEGYTTHSIHFPTEYTVAGREIQKWLNGDVRYDNQTIQVMYELDRLIAQQQIDHALHYNDYVILDRYNFSNLIWGLRRGFSLFDCLSFQKWQRKPDLGIIIDLPVEVASFRINKDREKDELEKQVTEKMRNDYKSLASIYNYHIVDGSRSIEEVNNEIMDIILGYGGKN